MTEKTGVRSLLRLMYKVEPMLNRVHIVDPIIEEEFGPIYERCRRYTMTSIECMYALYQSVRYLHASRISGDFVECGVWRGGSSMVMASTLMALGSTNRTVHLYDTFRGMSRPTSEDVGRLDGHAAGARWQRDQRAGFNAWAYSPLEEVRRNVGGIGYPADRVRYVPGEVETTIPQQAPERIALLRLDTDWYSSTKHELTHLYPRLAPGGVLIVDDYGHWEGARKAVDEYFADRPILLNRIDFTARIAIKSDHSV